MTTHRPKTDQHEASVPVVAKLPTPAALATQLDVTLDPVPKPAERHRLRKGLPGYAAMLDDVAELLAQDAATLNVPAITPARLHEAQAKYKDLRAREALLEAVYQSVYQQRLEVDDEAMGMLLTLARRVRSRAEEDPQLPARWSLLLHFLETFRPGRPSKPRRSGASPSATPPLSAPATEGESAKG